MRFDILTLFPEMTDSIFSYSIISRAMSQNLIEIHSHNIRDYSTDKHRRVDDTPYGGGMGMLMSPQPIFDCHKAVKGGRENVRTIYMSPQGTVFNHQKALELREYDNIIILCGHYEGVDQRVIDEIVDEEISIGDYVLTGGELAAAVVVDAVARLCEGVLSDKECYEKESIAGGLLEYPQYTRPFDFHGLTVPEVLNSGHHANIELWRLERAVEKTLRVRPDLIENGTFDKKTLKVIERIKKEYENQQ
ncbi:MAG: tRNA (guanosine(37)-N1)-methyltransferase TrmD [Clostridia bacterium]|nr:tRNA (guanosine(37)-N1)-methyltransferase TrmD [Clostridia bacterium]